MPWFRKARRKRSRSKRASFGKGTLTRNGVRLKTAAHRDEYLHRVVYERAHGKLPRGYDVDHKDRNKRNNRLGNLRRVRHARHPLVTFKGKTR